MENLIFTQLSIPEVKRMFRQELESFFENHKQNLVTQTEQDQLLNIKQAAALVNLSVPTLYQRVQHSKIPVIKSGGKLLFSRFELLAFVKSGRRKTINEIDQEIADSDKRNKGARS